MMKTLRKSRNATTRLQISTPILHPAPPPPGPPSASAPPQKVIRAVASAPALSPQHLPFQKGDFFYVTGDIADGGPYYHAHNPVTGVRGLVPKNLFEEFVNDSPVRVSNVSFIPQRTAKTRVFYAVVLHDFLAERADELDAKAGDPISVVAQSNREWFVAKPIGRLGRPGLIPASFVELRDPVSNLPIDDVDALMDRGDLPKVEDWKRAMFDYKQNSIPLGVIEDQQSVPNSPYSNTTAPPLPEPIPAVSAPPPPPPPPTPPPAATPTPRPPSQIPLPDGILLSADVVSFHYEMEEYWFRIDAIFQPYDPHDPHVLPKARQLVLFRSYNDFYDFQVSLLDTFPQEAGREAGSTRILPFMPGPADKVDDEVTAIRREELDQYIHKLCDLNSIGASYVLEHQLIRNFLSVKSGDVENDTEPRYNEISALFSEGADDAAGVTRGFEEEVRDTLGEMKLSDRDDRSDASDYGEDPTPLPQPHPRTSSSAYPRIDTHVSTRQVDPHPDRNGDLISPHRERSNGYPNVLRVSHGSSASNTQWPEYSTSSPSSLRSSQPSLTTRSRSHSSATTNMNAPPMSAGNPQIAFVKIKIFDCVTDDLIAIRVHPKVTHSELMTKVQGRLGLSISSLRYRDSLHSEFVGLEGDQDLRAWIDGAEKHVLYAD